MYSLNKYSQHCHSPKLGQPYLETVKEIKFKRAKTNIRYYIAQRKVS